ncbi:MAG: hypothetical protein Q8R35_02560 [bacterium]|nr:hypothetical protein [bacterium]
MLIYFLTIISGAADAANRVVIKVTHVSTYTLLGFGYLFAIPYYLFGLFLVGIPEVRPEFWWAVERHIPLFTLASILTVEAHRRGPLILTATYLTFTPAFMLLISPWMGGGSPNAVGAAAVLGLVIGAYVLHTKELQKGLNLRPDQRRDLLAPFRELARERGSLLMLLVSFIFAFTANLDYVAFRAANIPFYLAVDHGAVSAICFLLALIYWAMGRREIDPRTQTERTFNPAGSWHAFALWGMFAALSTIPNYLALRQIGVVPYAFAGKRMGTILFSVLYGIVLGSFAKFADERKHIRWRLAGVAIMVTSMLVIMLWGKDS